MRAVLRAVCIWSIGCRPGVTDTENALLGVSVSGCYGRISPFMKTCRIYFCVISFLAAAALSVSLLCGCGGGGGGSNSGTNTATIFGRVVDNIGFPVQGATVTIGSLSASTGSDGKFSLSGVAKDTTTVVVSATGYLTIRPSYSIIDNQQNLGDQLLEEDPTSPPPPPPPP